MVIVDDLRGHSFAEMVYDIAHQFVLAKELHLALFAVQHGKLLREVFRHIEITGLSYGRFIHNFEFGNPVDTELGDKFALVMVTDQVICIVVPNERVRGDGI